MLSPCLANVYLHRLDRQWADRGTGVLVRYAETRHKRMICWPCAEPDRKPNERSPL